MDSTQKFTGRAKDYIKARPGYPPELFSKLAAEIGMRPGWRVADIGSGTGKFTFQLLQQGYAVYGVEPNLEMRLAAESLIGLTRHFKSIDGTAERTTLEPASVEVVTAAQSFHWFEPIQCRAELKRILRPGGWVVVLWNERRDKASRFMEGYEGALMSTLPSYRASKGRGRQEDQSFNSLYYPNKHKHFELEHFTTLNWDGLVSLALSTSYVPKLGEPNHHSFMEALKFVYDRDQVNDQVRMMYRTCVYYGQIG